MKFALPLLFGVASAQSFFLDEEACQEDKYFLRSHIGDRFDRDLMAELDSSYIRILYPGDHISPIQRADRLNIFLDGDNKIWLVDCF
ncbi:hypothetical protein ASPWEDRAFT_43947 [Aspergillus wentii DTO 134E9]|uniref:Uncharacterized protein n=1 Tax=Aspergillus wentii DTO 134E9 TaxID=1073089 RepID=A0A1L9RAH1_ASPWE|nr:uncharacterized protein ASPWEDRAFT_43947 [Aspergillus wentii DTO 134E9]OJJ31926.1 hypothetical protein ASPWEDRAFT_43947 [Aspergillus wentii DTO 134E9]